MARGQSPLARAQARALRALGADTPPPAASSETSVFVMTPPSTSTGAGEDSSSRPSLAGAAEVSAPSSPLTASTGDASGAGSESSSTRPSDALGSALGAAPRSAADAPEAAPGANSADSQPQGSVSSSGVRSDGTCSAADAPEASFVAPGEPRFSSVRWEDIEDIVTAGTDRTVRQVQGSTQSQFLALARLVVDLNRRPPLRTELDHRLEAAGSLSDVVSALAPVPRSPAPWEYELTELRDDVASLEARLAASEASLRRQVDLRLKAERLCNQASHERNAALKNLRRIRLDHVDAARQLMATNIALEQSSQAAAALAQRCRRLDKSLADTHKVFRHDREQFKAGISSYAAQLRQLREYLEQSDRQSSASGGASSASASAIPAAFATFLEELGALQLANPPPSAASGSSEGSELTPPASSGSLGGTAARSGSSTSLTVDSDDSDGSGPIIPSAPHKGKAAWSAFSGFEGSESREQAAAAVVSSSGPYQSVPSSLPDASLSTSSAPISGIAVSADSDVLSFASIPSGSDPPFSPIPRAPASPASSTASTASLPIPQLVSRGITPGTEALVPVEIDDNGGLGADEAASEASVAPGGVFSSPVVSQPWRDGRPTRAASMTAGLRSMIAAENEAAPDALVLGLATPSRMPAATQASAASSASLPDLANPLLEPAFTAPGAQEAWCEILNARIPQPIASDRVTECSIFGIQTFADWEDPLHPWQRLRALLPEPPCTFGADDFMPDKPISIRASGLAIVVKLWRLFTGRAVGRSEHSDLGCALWECAHWISVAAIEHWLQ
ncbi:unnamed protein product [Phytophthora fragariaefolia]|uniref:Unnamed protein product n=1 Tax=Phytophthora fragariaefolia TaxID=1490495 RepID=A0A9W6TIT2_9STRA|nr:unnamed protein product [Phytophthora fragariaefolia]